MQRTRLFLGAFLILATVSALAGCGNKQATPGSTPAPSPGGSGAPVGQPAGGGAQMPTVQMGEAAALNGVRVTLIAVQKTPSKLAPSTRTGLALSSTIENGATQSFLVNTVNIFVLEDPEGRTYRVSPEIALPGEDRLDGDLATGKKQQGWFGFDVLPKDGEWTLQVKLPDKFGEGRIKFPFPK